MKIHVFAILFLVTGACASAKTRYEQGKDAEAEGRFGRAFDKYVEVLRKDPEYPGARERAHKTGTKAIQGIWRVLTGFESSGEHERATGEYDRIERVIRKAASVRVVLQRPAGFAERRRATFARATENLLAAAEAGESAGRWREAADLFAKASRAYEPTAEQRTRARQGQFRALASGARAEVEAERYDRAESVLKEALQVYGPDAPESQPLLELRGRIQEGRLRTLVERARSEMENGRFLTAYRTADQALQIYGSDAPESAAVHQLREEIVQQGTVRVAVVPVWRTRRMADRVPAGLLDELNGRLEDDAFKEPPLFVAVEEMAKVRQEARRLDLHRRVLDDRAARRLGRAVGADLVVVLLLSRADVVPLGQPTLYVVRRRGNRTAEIEVFRRRGFAAQCDFRLVDVPTSRTLLEGDVAADADRRLRHATYDGDYRALLLTPEQHRWFDRRRLRKADRENEQEALDKLVPGLETAIYDATRKFVR